MTKKFEQNIRKWYNKSQTVNLEYLDLAENSKPKLSKVANNIGVVVDKICLLSKVSLKHFYKISEENSLLRKEVAELRTIVQNLEQEFYSQKPLSKQEVRQLIVELAKQPKLVEEEALKLTEELKLSVKKVEYLINEVKGLIGG